MTSSFSRYFENLSLCLNSLTIVCLGWFCLSLPCLEYIKIVGYVDFIIFSEFGEFYIIISSNIVSAPFFFTWDTHNIHVMTLLTVSHRFQWLCPLFFSCLLPRLYNLKWPIFKCARFSTCSDLFLNPSSDFFISIIVFFSSRIST